MEERKKRRLHPFLIFFIVLMALTLLLCGTVLGLWFHGRSTLTQSGQTPALPAVSQDTDSNEVDANTVVYNGRRYRYNENMCNILLMGIDSDETPETAAGSRDQADVLVLAALDMATDEMTLIYIPRDIVCDMEITDETGEVTAIRSAHLALAYAYGDGQHGSCRLTSSAVSNIFYGLPIHGYGAYYMQGIAALNDAVGGVTVSIKDDYPFTAIPGGDRMIAGQDVTLTGEEAVAYIRCRLEHQADSNRLRMARQEQYMLALMNQAKEKVKNDPLSIMTLYNALQDYILTDLDLSFITYLATEAVSMQFSNDILSLTGELSLDEENRAVLTLDEDALYDLMLDVFYTKIE